MKIGIIGNLNSKNTQDLVSFCNSLNHETLVLGINEIIFDFRKAEPVVLLGNKKLEDFDRIIFRGFSEHTDEAKIIASYLKHKRVPFSESVLGYNPGYFPNKIYQSFLLLKNKIPIPQTVALSATKVALRIPEYMNYPFVLKNPDSSQGKGIYLIKNKKDLSEIKLENCFYICQEYIKHKFSFRLLTLGGKIVGAVKNINARGEFKSNVSRGGRTIQTTLSKDLKDLTKRIFQVIPYDFAGIDLLRRDNKFFVLEVNSTPQWQGLQFATKINVAKEFIKHLL